MKINLHKRDRKYPLQDRAKFIQILTTALEYIINRDGASLDFELNLCLLGSTDMAALNVEYVGHEGATDVITFDLRDEFEQSGEVYICPAIADERAEEFKSSFDQELILYAVHGMLHLFGEDDKTPAAQALMTKAENDVITYLKDKFQNFEGIFKHEK